MNVNITSAVVFYFLNGTQLTAAKGYGGENRQDYTLNKQTN